MVSNGSKGLGNGSEWLGKGSKGLGNGSYGIGKVTVGFCRCPRCSKRTGAEAWCSGVPEP